MMAHMSLAFLEAKVTDHSIPASEHIYLCHPPGTVSSEDESQFFSNVKLVLNDGLQFDWRIAIHLQHEGSRP